MSVHNPPLIFFKKKIPLFCKQIFEEFSEFDEDELDC